MFRFIVFQNHDWNAITTRSPRGIKIGYDLLSISGITWVFCSFRLLLDVNASKEIPESSKLKFSDMISGSNFALLDADIMESDAGIANQIRCRNSRFTFVEKTISNLPNITTNKIMGGE